MPINLAPFEGMTVSMFCVGAFGSDAGSLAMARDCWALSVLEARSMQKAAMAGLRGGI